MTFTIKLLLIAAIVLGIIIPFGYFLLGEKQKARFKKALGANLVVYFGCFVVAALMMFGGHVEAAETATAAASSAAGFAYVAAALSTGLSCIGGGIAVSSAASAALGAISEDSSILGKSLIFIGLAEGVCLYGLIVSFMILGRV